MKLNFFKSIYIDRLLYLSLGVLSLIYILGYYSDHFLALAKVSFFIFSLAVILDIYLLFLTGRKLLSLKREIPEKLSNGDINKIYIYIKNDHFFKMRLSVIDEIPWQFQIRNFQMNITLDPGKETRLEYELQPLTRGDYEFGTVNVYVRNIIGLFSRRFSFCDPVTTPVYPSYLNLRKYEILAISNRLNEAGIKKIRRIGQNYEFDQIKDYSLGDDMRSVNWKATAKRGKLMTNQYQDERSQQVYSIIDMGRSMKMPFRGMTLLHYAINSSLVLAKMSVNKQDKAGLITFNTNIGAFLKAERRFDTVQKISEILYKQKTLFYESNFELLYSAIRRQINHRSFLILYTNFETLSSLKRQMAFLQKLSHYHLLMAVFFENSEISELTDRTAESLEEIYIQTIARKFVYEKQLLVRELQRHGILTILTKPENLTVNLINRYLELKDRGLI